MSLLVIGGLTAMGVGGYMLIRNRRRKRAKEPVVPTSTRSPGFSGRYGSSANNSPSVSTTSESSRTSDFASGAVVGAILDHVLSSTPSKSSESSWSSPSRSSEESYSGGGGSSSGGGSSYSYSSDSSSSYSSSDSSSSSSSSSSD